MEARIRELEAASSERAARTEKEVRRPALILMLVYALCAC